jgi:hypothetical protein
MNEDFFINDGEVKKCGMKEEEKEEDSAEDFLQSLLRWEKNTTLKLKRPAAEEKE